MKKKSLKGKLILSVATLGLAASSTIGSTFAWFTINESASAKGVNMTATSGDLIMIRKGSHKDVFTNEVALTTTSGDAKWMPVTPITDTSTAAVGVTTHGSGDDSDVKWGALNLNSTLTNKTITYNELSLSKETNTDVYTTSTTVSYTTTTTTKYIAYAHFNIDYVVSKATTPVLKIEGIDNIENESFKKSVRIAIAQASEISVDNNTWTVTYDDYTSYALENASSDDLQLKALQELGLPSTVASQNKTATTYSDTGISLNSKETSANGSDKLGSISVYVWLEGNAYDCTNSAQSGSCDLSLSFDKSATA